MAVSADGFLRYATPNERRCISREKLGYYNVVAVGGIYAFRSTGASSEQVRQRVTSALKLCVEQHGCLAVLVRSAETEKPYFQRVREMQLSRHVELVSPDVGGGETKGATNDAAVMERHLDRIMDAPLTAGIPGWKVMIQEMQPASGSEASRFLITFAYSHSFADGVSGLAFHQSLIRALRDQDGEDWEPARPSDNSGTMTIPTSLKIAEPFDTKSRLPVSWLYMLTPLLAVFLPEWLSRLFGLRAAVSTIDEGTWIGSPMFYEANNFKTRISVLEIDPAALAFVIKAGRHHNTKLTAILHGLVVRALSTAVDRFHTGKVTNLVSTTAVNMRRSIGMRDDRMGLFASGHYAMHPKAESHARASWSPEFWIIAQKTTQSLAHCATTLADQPVALLRYLPSVRKWTQSKLGQKRDSSYEISNLGAFDGRLGSADDKLSVVVDKMVFCQPASVTSPPIAFNFVSVKGSSLICAISWQAGALGCTEEHEPEFVQIVCTSLLEDIASFATREEYD